jgi:hypothetical protein
MAGTPETTAPDGAQLVDEDKIPTDPGLGVTPGGAAKKPVVVLIDATGIQPPNGEAPYRLVCTKTAQAAAEAVDALAKGGHRLAGIVTTNARLASKIRLENEGKPHPVVFLATSEIAPTRRGILDADKVQIVEGGQSAVHQALLAAAGMFDREAEPLGGGTF